MSFPTSLSVVVYRWEKDKAFIIESVLDNKLKPMFCIVVGNTNSYCAHIGVAVVSSDHPREICPKPSLEPCMVSVSVTMLSIIYWKA